jgi:hypothetical protein
MTLGQRTKRIAKPYIAQYKRSPWWVKSLTLGLIGLIILPDPFDWFPGVAFLDELLYATLLLKLLYKYGALPSEVKTSPKDLVKEILRKDESR